jgi:glycopeptide antibiotics resistance protein
MKTPIEQIHPKPFLQQVKAAKTALKTRAVYICAFLTAIVSGISSRQFTSVLPAFAVSHFGDILWASMVYFGFRIVCIKSTLIPALLVSLLFSFGIEFSQLYQAQWIQEVRATLLGSLVLGRGFLTVDLVRYTLGIAGAYALDRILLRRHVLQQKQPKTKV